MTDAMLMHIPAAHRDAVGAALLEAFCGEPVESVTPLTGGRSGALVYRVVIGDNSWALRLVPNPNPFNSPARQFAAMHTAAASAIAPAVRYSNAESGIVISDFVTAVPWQQAFDQSPELIGRLGQKIRTLHDGPAITPFLDVFECIDGGLAALHGAGVMLPPLLVKFLTNFEPVRTILAAQMEMVACHNDLNPGNLLYDGKDLWIIDWESAWQNDPMLDVATLLHWFALEGDRKDTLLRGYFGGEPTAKQLAKIELMAQVTACYYGLVFLLITLQSGQQVPALDPDPEALPSFAEVRAQMASHSLALDTAESRTMFALAMINDAMKRMTTGDFRDAMVLLAPA